jgi:hypothetical protein
VKVKVAAHHLTLRALVRPVTVVLEAVRVKVKVIHPRVKMNPLNENLQDTNQKDIVLLHLEDAANPDKLLR